MFTYFKKSNSLKKELQSLNIYVFKIEDYSLRARISHLLDWYVRKATFYKNLFYSMSVILIIINALIPVISQSALVNKDIIISFGSSIATIISSALTLFTMKDTWFRYRNYAELIKEECMKYNSCYGDYNNDKAQLLLSQNIELIINSERTLWKDNKFNEKDDKDKR
ncbi:DUF4231 domain-containing protein [Clostridium perfringens]|uniref:DUF4231 domain-containing protein n=1 Tax=Clostridium perfringens TaxID=1502 RepID=UPI0024BCAFEF|nr:DUF4231 domain-containing protein [Clostridium perfringens]MDK0734008.1 DUF4231 domain-containing protein [Clostridium perfringens]MDM0469814.1 DUF4231 domain-containing protein [Clostridium perfringens]